MRVKLLTFKPNKSGETTLYLGAGVDLRELIDLIGQDVIIELAAGKAETPVDDGLKTIIAMIQTYGETKYRTAVKNIGAGLTDEPVDIFEFKEGTGNE